MSYIKTPKWISTAKFYRKTRINLTEMKKVVKDRSVKEKNSRTKCFMYSSGPSSSLAENIFKGRTLSSKEVDEICKTYFPEKDWKDKVLGVVDVITDKCWPADSSLLENSSEYDISIVLDPIIKSPVVEGQVNLLGLEKFLPLARVGLSYKESSYNNPGDHIMEDTLYKDSTKILTMKNWEDPVQGEWRRQGEETPHSILIAKNKHLVFDGASVEEGALTARKSQWNI